MAVAFQSLGTHAVTPACLVQPKPANLSFEQAATIPIAFLTAYYALNTLGRIRRGERVLIHAAAGGVGLAAVQLAQLAGAEIFATAGSDEKRAMLHTLGVQHVMDSRSLDFAKEIITQTGGQGVDLALNSLAGAALHKTLSILAPYGRFLEIGKRDIYQNTHLGLEPFQKNLSYFAIDLDRMARERPGLLGDLFAEVADLLQQGAIRPLPMTVFPVEKTADAFHYMAQARHTGKIVIRLTDQNPMIRYVNLPPTRIHPDATYMITGGLGSLGLTVAGWLVEQGARHLVLVGRSGLKNLSPESRQILKGLESLGAHLQIIAADISQEEQVLGLFHQITITMPPLRGVIHAAGVLDDGILLQQNPQRVHSVMAPKANGAWHLHQLTKDLDFFILFSSVTAPLGSPGQGNYAAANAFLDGLAHYRRSLGLPALSIDWGPWSQIGMAAQRQQGGTQGLGGLSTISPKDGLDILNHLLKFDLPQVLATKLDTTTWVNAHPSAGRSSLFTGLLTASESISSPVAKLDVGGIRASLLLAEPGRSRRTLLDGFIQEQVAQVLRLSPTRVDIHKPLRTLGMDSLMTIEFRNRLESSLGVTLSATLVWNYPTVAELTSFLAEKIGIPLDTDVPSIHDQGPVLKATISQNVSPEEQLSSEEISSLLDDELDKINELLKDN
jgi:NADPH:quinone reductase-like Zn-dependent oxidoreductase/acyl carrier protein